jgi:hypothetical protein
MRGVLATEREYPGRAMMHAMTTVRLFAKTRVRLKVPSLEVRIVAFFLLTVPERVTVHSGSRAGSPSVPVC